MLLLWFVVMASAMAATTVTAATISHSKKPYSDD